MQLNPNYWSISSEIIATRAEKLGFEVQKLVADQNLFVLKKNGKQFYFKNVKSDRTSSVAYDIAEDKYLTKAFLQNIGAPLVEGGLLFSVEELSSTKIPYPIVLKPVSESHGTGVHTNIQTEEEAKKILSSLLETYKSVLVESYHKGINLRLLQIGGRCVSAIARYAPRVMGDGISTIDQLIEAVNAQRGEGHTETLSKIPITADLRVFLTKEGLSLETVPKEGETVFLAEKINASIGGTYEWVFDQLPVATKKWAESVTQHIVPDGILALDILCEDFTREVDQNSLWKILELEVAPSLRSHPPEILDEWLTSL